MILKTNEIGSVANMSCRNILALLLGIKKAGVPTATFISVWAVCLRMHDSFKYDLENVTDICTLKTQNLHTYCVYPATIMAMVLCLIRWSWQHQQ
jgi:hypothetical protein